MGMGVNIPWVGGSIYKPMVYRPLPMVYRPPYQWYIDPPTLYNYWLLMRSTHDYQVRIVMSRLKLKVNNCLLNNKEFFKLFNKIGYNCFIIFQDDLIIKILKYDENFEILWNFWKFWNCINFEIYKINKKNYEFF